MRGRTMKPCIEMPRVTVTRYQTNFLSSTRTDFMWRISPAIRKATPTGARWTTHWVTFIITWDTDLKKLRRGFPSSPERAMATPVATEKMTRPRMLVLEFQVESILQLVISSGSIIAPVVTSSSRPLLGCTMTVLYCCMVAWTRLGGKQLVTRSRRVSTAVPAPSSPFSMTWSVLAVPGLMVTQRTMPRLTARKVVTM